MLTTLPPELLNHVLCCTEDACQLLRFASACSNLRMLESQLDAEIWRSLTLKSWPIATTGSFVEMFDWLWKARYKFYFRRLNLRPIRLSAAHKVYSDISDVNNAYDFVIEFGDIPYLVQNSFNPNRTKSEMECKTRNMVLCMTLNENGEFYPKHPEAWSNQIELPRRIPAVELLVRRHCDGAVTTLFAPDEVGDDLLYNELNLDDSGLDRTAMILLGKSLWRRNYKTRQLDYADEGAYNMCGYLCVTIREDNTPILTKLQLSIESTPKPDEIIPEGPTFIPCKDMAHLLEHLVVWEMY